MLQRRTALKPGKPLKRGKGLRFRSAKTAKVYREERVPLVLAILEERLWCELRFPGCSGRATVVDERKQRSRGGSITDPANLIAACALCNGYKEDHPAEADARGLALHSWDEVADGHADSAAGCGMTSLALLSAADFLLVPVAPCSACLLSHPVDHDCRNRPEEIPNA